MAHSGPASAGPVDGHRPLVDLATTASDPDAVVVVLTTIGSEAEAAGLARQLLDERLLACVNCVPGLRSIYRWQDAVEDTAECLMLMKTARHRLEALRERLHACHPYETPEWIVIETAEISAAYRAWLLAQL